MESKVMKKRIPAAFMDVEMNEEIGNEDDEDSQ